MRSKLCRNMTRRHIRNTRINTSFLSFLALDPKKPYAKGFTGNAGFRRVAIMQLLRGVMR